MTGVPSTRELSPQAIPNTFVTEIIAGEPQYYLDDNGVWWQAEYGTTTKEAFNAQTRPPLLSGLFQKAFILTLARFIPMIRK